MIEDAAHRRAVAGEFELHAIAGDAVDASRLERFPQAFTAEILGPDGGQPLVPVTGHVRPVVGGADRAEVQAAIQRLLVGRAPYARSHVRVAAHADPFFVALGTAVDGVDFGEGADLFVAGVPRGRALADVVAGVVRDGEGVGAAQKGVEFG